MSQTCQSCGIRMIKHDEFGTYSKGVKNLNYCNHCFDNGAFLEPDLTLEQMIEKLLKPMMVNKRITEDEARANARAHIENLKRWKKEGE